MAEVDFVRDLKPEVKAEIVPNNGEAIIPATANQGMQLAIRQGNVDALLKFFELQERIDAREARKAFDVAFAAFKAEAPKLTKTKPVSFDNGKNIQYKYTPLDEIAEAVGSPLARHGLSYNWEQAQLQDGVIAIACILRHAQGHSIQNTLSAKADPSGSKNAIQAIGSAVSYLRRYTLLGVLGMATGDDSDGNALGSLDDAEVEKNVKEISHAKDQAELKFLWTVACDKAREAKDADALTRYTEAKDARKKELGNAAR